MIDYRALRFIIPLLCGFASNTRVLTSALHFSFAGPTISLWTLETGPLPVQRAMSRCHGDVSIAAKNASFARLCWFMFNYRALFSPSVHGKGKIHCLPESSFKCIKYTENIFIMRNITIKTHTHLVYNPCRDWNDKMSRQKCTIHHQFSHLEK